MATLTETAYYSRKVVNLSLVAVIVFIILRIVLMATTALYHAFFPTPPPPATLAFGKLPYPKVDTGLSTPSAKITYTLETADGTLPVLPPTAKVYFMPKPQATFDSFDTMKLLAGQMGFTGNPIRINSTEWRFTDSTTPLRTLDIDQVTKDFILSYNYLLDTNLFQEKSLALSDQNFPRSYLSGLGVLTPELTNGDQSVFFFRFDSGKLVPATSLSTADALSVTFNREKLDDFPVLSPNPKRGLVSVLLSGSSDSLKKVLEVRYLYSPIQADNVATYPLITSQKALDQLKSGQAIFASIPTQPTSTIVIRQIFQAYLDTNPSQPYLQPVLVFSDEKDFLAYVPIITDKWLIPN